MVLETLSDVGKLFQVDADTVRRYLRCGGEPIRARAEWKY